MLQEVVCAGVVCAVSLHAQANLANILDSRYIEADALAYDGQFIDGSGGASVPGAAVMSDQHEGFGWPGFPPPSAYAYVNQISTVQPSAFTGTGRAQGSATAAGAGPETWAQAYALSRFDVTFEISEPMIASVDLDILTMTGDGVVELAFVQLGVGNVYDPYAGTPFNGTLQPGTYQILAKAYLDTELLPGTRVYDGDTPIVGDARWRVSATFNLVPGPGVLAVPSVGMLVVLRRRR